MRCAKENCVKIAEFVEERRGHGAPIQFTCSPGIFQYHNENIPFPAKIIKNDCKSMQLSP